MAEAYRRHDISDHIAARSIAYDLFNSCLRKQMPDALNRKMDIDLYMMIGEHEQDYMNAPREENGEWVQIINSDDALHKAMRAIQSVDQTKDVKRMVFNIIEIWRYSRDYIDGEDLSYLDLRDIRVFPYIKNGKFETKFNNSKINSNTFFAKGHSSLVKTAAYSPDGSRVVTASSDRTAKIWDAESGTLIQILNNLYNRRYEGCSFNETVFDDSMNQDEIDLLQRYSR